MRKLTVLLLVACMIFASLPMYAAVDQDPITDGSESSAEWFQMFDNILQGGKIANANDFFDVLGSLKNISVANIQTVLSQNPTNETMLLGYGLDAVKIQDIIMYYLDTYPDSLADVILDGLNQGNNIYSDIYHEENDIIVYSEYMVRFYDYLNDQYSNLPQLMKDPIPDWDVAKQGEIHVFQNILNSLIKDYIFHVQTNTVTGAQTKLMYLRAEMEQVIVNELEFVAGLSSTEIDDYAKMYLELGNVILKASEINLKNSGNIDKAIRLGDLVIDSSTGRSLVRRTTFTPEDDPVLTPGIVVSPALATVFLNPTPDTNESDQIQFISTVFDSTSAVVWSVVANPVVTIDQNGNVKINEGYVQDINSPTTVRVRAALETDTDVFDEATVSIEYNAPLAGVRFFGPYIRGYEDGNFKAGRYVSRAEAAAMFTRVFSLDVKTMQNADNQLVPMYTKETLAAPNYIDISKAHWAYLNIEIAKKEGLLDGYADGSFQPDTYMTRAEVAVLISDALATRPDIEQDFSAKHEIIDVKKDHWAYREINAMFNALVVDGYADNSFKPDEFLQRDQLVQMINSIIGRPEYKLPGNKFKDVEFGQWSYGDIIAATMFQAFEDGKFILKESLNNVEQ